MFSYFFERVTVSSVTSKEKIILFTNYTPATPKSLYRNKEEHLQ